MNIYSEICVLLTGTINPGDVPDLIRSNASDREADYIKSISKWLKLNLRIVFIENSNYESLPLTNILREHKNFEYIKFKSQVSHLGKSHGEAEIVKYGLAQSKFIAETKYIVKVTGRNFVLNIGNLLKDLDKANNVDAIVWLTHYTYYSDSRFFIGTKLFYDRYLTPKFYIISEDQNIYFEHALARATHSLIADGYIWQLPSETPLFEGFSGTAGVKYKNDIFRVLKRNIAHKLYLSFFKL